MSHSEESMITAEHIRQAAINIRERDAADSQLVKDLNAKLWFWRWMAITAICWTVLLLVLMVSK